MANQDFVGVPSQVDARSLSRTATDFQRLRRGLLINYIVLGAGAILMVVPFIWMVSTSFKPQAETVSFPPRLFPINPTVANYIDVFDRANMGQLYWNTTFVSVIKTILNIYTSALLGYIFGKFVFRGRDVIFYLLLSTWIIPFEVYLIPLYLMTVQVGWADTFTALIVPEIFTIYAMFMFRQFMYTIPSELIDAARIDGAGEWYIFHRIIIPLSKAALFTLIAFYFMWNWNDFSLAPGRHLRSRQIRHHRRPRHIRRRILEPVRCHHGRSQPRHHPHPRSLHRRPALHHRRRRPDRPQGLMHSPINLSFGPATLPILQAREVVVVGGS